MKILSIALNDLTRSFRSAFAIGMMVVAPLLLTGLIYFAFGSMSGGDVAMTAIRVGVVNADQLPADSVLETPIGDNIRTMFFDESVESWITAADYPDEASARAAVDVQEIGVAVIIPENFTEHYLSGEQDVQVLILSDPTLSIGPAVVQDMVSMMVDGVAGGGIAIQTIMERLQANGVTGDFDKAGMVALLREAFGDWAKGTVPEVTIPAVAESDFKSGLVRFVNKDTSQTHLRVGHLTVKETHPDYVAVAIANDILGGSSFRSRLFNDVRTKRGLAYSVGSGLRASVYDEGVWLMRAETKLSSTQEVVNRFVANMERMRNEPVTDAELEEAKEAYVNSFVFSFTSASSIVARLMDLEYDGLPKDWLQQIRDKVVKLTKDDIQRAAKTHFNPDRLRILAVGSGDALSKVLASFGEVKEITLAPES